MTNFIKRYAIVILIVLGFVTRLAYIWYPANVVWDEQHFCNFTKGYLDGKYFFDIHPPLGKLFLYSALKLNGATTENLDCGIGNEYPAGYPYVASRIPPAVAGTLVPVVIYLFGRALLLSPAASFFAAMLIVFDNAIFAEAHFALIDIFVPLFGFFALFAFLKHRQKVTYTRPWWVWLFMSAISAALAVSTKWTAGSALLVIGIATFIESVEKRSFKLFFVRLAPVVGITAAVYLGLFALHFKLLPFSGTGDAFMSERFRVSLEGSYEEQQAVEAEKNGAESPSPSTDSSASPKAGSGQADTKRIIDLNPEDIAPADAAAGPEKDLRPLSFLARFAEVNKRMFGVNASQKLTHQDSSRFYEWPVGRKRIYFWVDKIDGQKRIYLFANPIVWLFAAIATFGSIMYLIFRRRAIHLLVRRNAEWKTRIRSLEFLFMVYIVNLLPFAAISRAMFLYHYFSSLIASILIGAFLVFNFVPALENASLDEKNGTKEEPEENFYVYWILLALVIAAFLLFSPLSYGFKTILK